MDNRILTYIPARKREAVHDCWFDDDGYWVMIREGWHIKDYFAEHTIHEDTLDELKTVAKQIVKDRRR
jgi:hypothetical protein